MSSRGSRIRSQGAFYGRAGSKDVVRRIALQHGNETAVHHTWVKNAGRRSIHEGTGTEGEEKQEERRTEQPSDGAERPGGRPIYRNRTSASLLFALTAHVTNTSQGEVNTRQNATRPSFYQEKCKVNFSCFIMVYIDHVYPN